MSEPLAVIFDMDGVLVDSYEAHYESWRQMGEEQGWSFTREQFDESFGRTSREIIQLLWGDVANLNEQEVAQFDDRKESLYREILHADFPAMDGATELIDALRADGFRLAIGSSGPPANVAAVLDELGRADAFSARVTGADVTRGKPDPQVFEIAAKRLEVPASRCVVVEDAPAGIAAAKAAQMKNVGVASTGRTRAQLAVADYVVGNLRELSPDVFRSLLAQSG